MPASLKVHMRNAIRLGATPEEICKVLEIAIGLGLHTAMVACPILEEVVAAQAYLGQGRL
ncbi:hypothetical protein LTR08_003628 [Meristemomyces frigidus]|nr:hypothetical protein LTR08_003628 [Meristemomyces frigidus]